jgi:tetratricopeptide (TPR) repeat protein
MARGQNWASETSDEQFKEMKRYFSLALQDVGAALKMNPKVDVCYQLMIQIAMAVRDDILKKNALLEALKYRPYGYRVRHQYLYSLTPRWGGSYNKMEEFVEQSEKYSGYNPELKSLRAVIPADKADILEREGSYEEAIKLYTAAIRLKESASFYAARGHCHYNLDEYVRALEDYNHALEMRPNNPDYLRMKSSVLFKLKRLSEAQDALEMAERLDPNDKWIQKKKEFYQSDAVKAYDRGQKGFELMKAGKYEEAIGELTEAIYTNPDEPLYYFNRGVCYLQLQRYELSLKDLRDAVARKRDFAKAYDAIGWAEYNLGKYDEALEAINTAVKLEPDNAEAYFNRAMIYDRKGRKDEAVNEARRACSMGYQPACLLREQLTGK